jgi:hypothetical protein
MMYRLISAEKARTPISIACELLGVAPTRCRWGSPAAGPIPD